MFLWISLITCGCAQAVAPLSYNESEQCMTTEIQQFGAFFRERVDQLLDPLLDAVTRASAKYAAEDRRDLRDTLRQLSTILAESMENDDLAGINGRTKATILRQANQGFPVQDVLIALRSTRDTFWQQLNGFMQEYGQWSPRQIRHFEDFFFTLTANIATTFGDMLLQARTDLIAQADQLEAQSNTIRELGTPILPIHTGVLVLPLVGSVDSRRATQVMENLLEAITQHQADIVIIDITGVPVVDTGVANYLLQTARAAQLVGARVVLVGIGAEIAQTIVHLGVDLSGIVVYANLQAGLQYALEQLGHRIV